MNTRNVSLNHPSVTREKLAGRKAVASNGRVGVLTNDPLAFGMAVTFPDETWLPTGPIVKLVVEDPA